MNCRIAEDGLTVTDLAWPWVVACNPYNKGIQTVKIRDPQSGRPATFELVGDYPLIKQFK